MKARDQVRVDTLRSALSAFSYRRIEAGRELSEADQLDVVRKQYKQRGDSIVEFERAGRAELVAKETRERDILAELLAGPEERRRDSRRGASRDRRAATRGTQSGGGHEGGPRTPARHRRRRRGPGDRPGGAGPARRGLVTFALRGGSNQRMRLVRLVLFGAALTIGAAGLARGASHRDIVVVPITGTVDEGMAHLVERAVDEANADARAGARARRQHARRPRRRGDGHPRRAVPCEGADDRLYFGTRLFCRRADLAQHRSHRDGAGLEHRRRRADPEHREEHLGAARRSSPRPRRASTTIRRSRARWSTRPSTFQQYKKPGAILSLTADEAASAGIADAHRADAYRTRSRRSIWASIRRTPSPIASARNWRASRPVRRSAASCFPSACSGC